MFVFFVLAAVIGLCSTAPTYVCPPGVPVSMYTKVYGDSCFEFAEFERRDYEGAEQFCENQGGTLAMIKSVDIQLFIWNEIHNNYHTAATKQWWIGLHDKASETHFVWEDGTPLGSYENWQIGYGPDHGLLGSLVGIATDCVAMDSDTGNWRDHHCQSNLLDLAVDVDFPFICQFQAVMVTTTAAPTTTASTTTTMTSTATAPSPAILVTTPTTATTTIASATPTVTTAATTMPPTTPPTTTPPTTTIPLTTPVPTTTPITSNPTTITLPPTMTTPSTTPILPTSTAATATVPTSTIPSIAFVTSANVAPTSSCPPFVCSTDCGMNGYKADNVTGCSLCECN